MFDDDFRIPDSNRYDPPRKEKKEIWVKIPIHSVWGFFKRKKEKKMTMKQALKSIFKKEKM